MQRAASLGPEGVHLRTGLVVVLVAFGLALAGCGGDDSSSESGASDGGTSTSTETSEVQMSDQLRFDPAEVTVSEGATITVKNDGTLQHDLKLRQNGKEVGGTDLVDGGKSASLKVTVKPGTYEMFCSVPGHEDGGMKGTFVVK
jgi:plastocyanin